MTTTFLATASALAQFAHGPLAGALDERAVAVGLNALVSRKPDHDDLPGGSQLADRSGEPRIIRIRRTNDADRKSTRLNSSHSQISYAVFCLKKKKKTTDTHS